MNWPGSSAEWLAWEPQARWWLYLFGFGAVIAWETLWPRKELVCDTGRRWCGQLAMMVLASWITLLVIPVSAIEVSFRVTAAGWGVLPNSGLPWAVQAVVGVLALDFVRFSQHWCFHRFDLLWRIHRIHHSDPDFDLTTGIRFHPLDPILSIATYIPVVWLLGVPPVAAMSYELAHVVHAFFSHANIRIPRWLDGAVRLVLVTPETHRIHHSDRHEENLRNFGEMFTVWDRVLGTFQEQPAGGHEGMRVGLPGLTGGRTYNPARLLAWPLWEKAMGVAAWLPARALTARRAASGREDAEVVAGRVEAAGD